MNEIVVREATPKDAQRIAQIHVGTWQCAYRGQIPDSYLDNLSVEDRTKSWKKQLKDLGEGVFAIVAEIDGRVVGWCTFGKNRDEDVSDDIGELHGIYVDAEFIGKGAGSAMNEEVVKRLKELGYKQATLWVLDTNKKTRGFYENKGWRVEGRKKDDVRDGFTLHEVRYVIDL